MKKKEKNEEKMTTRGLRFTPFIAKKDAYVLKKEINGVESICGVTMSEDLAKMMLEDKEFYGVSSCEQAVVFTDKLENDNNVLENLKQATETPFFGNNDNFAKELTEAGIKAAKATHEFNMKEIKAKLIADLCKELVKMPVRHEDVPQRAREIADKALENL